MEPPHSPTSHRHNTTLSGGNNNINPNFNVLLYNYNVEPTDTELDLFHKDVGLKEAIELAEALKKNQHLKCVTLKSQNIENKGAAAFAEMLKENTTLEELNLKSPGAVIVDLAAHRKDIESPGGISLGKALLENNTLTKLDLSCNFIGDEGTRAIAESLERNCTLLHLNLSENSITTRGAKALFQALKRASSLTTLILRRNLILDCMDDMLCNLKNNYSLSLLDLEGNRNPFSLAPFIELLKSNNTLVEIKISGGTGGTVKKHMDILEELLAKNRRFQENKIKWCGGDDKRFSASTDVRAGPTLNTGKPALSLKGFSYTEEPKKKRAGSILPLFLKEKDKASSLDHIPYNNYSPLPARNSLLSHSCEWVESPVKNQQVAKFALTHEFLESLREVQNNTRLDMGNLELSKTMLENIVDQLVKTGRTKFLSIQELFLYNNKLQSLPSALNQFQMLNIIIASKNAITALPEFLDFQSLTVLDLGHNQLRDLPASISSLTNLAHFDISRNQFEELPENIFKLTNLNTLFFNHNRVRALPKTISQLVKLTNLDASFNKLQAIPSEVCKIKNLSRVNVQKNELTSLPVEIGEMSKLTHLYMEFNQLEYLPVELHKLKDNLGVLGIKGNSLSTIPPSIKAKKSDLLGYLKELEKGSQWFSMLKLVFCGDGNVGKSSLLRSFRNEEMATDDENLATDGIDIRDWSFDCKNSKKITFRSLDFAGQPLYYNTHQFFVSADTLYLIVFNLTHENYGRVEYWLNTIVVRARGSPIIVVGTHADDKKCTKSYIKSTMEWMRNEYAEKFPDIVDFFVVSNKNGKGVKDLMSSLAGVAISKKLAGRVIPSSFMLLGKRLEQLGKSLLEHCQPPVISIKEFTDIAVEFNVEKENATKVLLFLNQVGQVIYLGNKEEKSSLNDFVFLDCQWLANIMSSVVSLKFRVKDGILNGKDLAQIWKLPLFPPSVHPTLLQILEKFEILYPLPPTITVSEPSYLVPSFMAEDRPSIVRELWPVFIDHQIPQFCRIFEFHFLPIGFFSRLVVRTLSMFEPICFWQNGMVVRSVLGKKREMLYEMAENENRALLEFNPSLFTLKATIRGRSAGHLLQALSESITNLEAGWFPGQLNRVLVPCVHCVRSQSYDPFMFTLADCQKEAAQGAQYMYCHGLRPVRLDLLASDVTLGAVEHMRIEFSDIEIGKLLGRGSFASVYYGVYRGEPVAVKKVELFGAETNKLMETADENEIAEEITEKFGEFRREVMLMSGLKHPNIVSLRGICLSPFCMITEFFAFGDLHKFLHNKVVFVSWKLRIKIALDIATGMQFLHGATPPIVHRDLKSPNILICGTSDKDPVCAKVADFGLSVRVGYGMKKRDVFNVYWLAPEIMREKEYTEKVDVYSFGVILWELLARENPFEEHKPKFKFNNQLEEAIMNGLRPTIPLNCPKVYKTLIEECWQEDPSMRPTFEALVGKLLNMQSTIDPSMASNANPTFFKKGVSAEYIAENSVDVNNWLTLGAAAGVGSKGENNSKIVEEVSENLHGNTHSVQCMAVVDFNIWCGCADGSITVWDKYTNTHITTLHEHTGEVFCIKVAGFHVWSSSHDKSIIVWDKTTHKTVKIIKQKEFVTCLESGGKWVWSGSENGYIKKWKKKSFKCAGDFKVEAIIGSMLYVPPNKMWIGTDKSIIIWDTNSTSCMTLVGHTAMVHCIVWVEPNVWTCSSDKTICVWSEMGQMLRTIPGHSARVFSLLPIGDTHVWSCSWDKIIMIWNAKDYSFLQELKGLHTDAVSSMVAVEANGAVERVWSASWDTSIACWKYKNAPEVPPSLPPVSIQGYMMKQGGEIKTWKTRWFVLSKGHLSYYENPADDKPIHSVDIRGCPLREEPVEVVGKKHAFSIETFETRKNIERRKFIMHCDTKEDMDAWLNQLRVYTSSARKSM